MLGIFQSISMVDLVLIIAHLMKATSDIIRKMGFNKSSSHKLLGTHLYYKTNLLAT